MSAPMRYVALFRGHARPLGGICPVCDRVMDESGCRIGEHLVSDDPSAGADGIAQVVEVFCGGAPTAPVLPCPSCVR